MVVIKFFSRYQLKFIRNKTGNPKAEIPPSAPYFSSYM